MPRRGAVHVDGRLAGVAVVLLDLRQHPVEGAALDHRVAVRACAGVADRQRGTAVRTSRRRGDLAGVRGRANERPLRPLLLARATCDLAVAGGRVIEVGREDLDGDGIVVEIARDLREIAPPLELRDELGDDGRDEDELDEDREDELDDEDRDDELDAVRLPPDRRYAPPRVELPADARCNPVSCQPEWAGIHPPPYAMYPRCAGCCSSCSWPPVAAFRRARIR